jgi:hypothetical protein
LAHYSSYPKLLTCQLEEKNATRAREPPTLPHLASPAPAMFRRPPSPWTAPLSSPKVPPAVPLPLPESPPLWRVAIKKRVARTPVLPPPRPAIAAQTSTSAMFGHPLATAPLTGERPRGGTWPPSRGARFSLELAHGGILAPSLVEHDSVYADSSRSFPDMGEARRDR